MDNLEIHSQQLGKFKVSLILKLNLRMKKDITRINNVWQWEYFNGLHYPMGPSPGDTRWLSPSHSSGRSTQGKQTRTWCTPEAASSDSESKVTETYTTYQQLSMVIRYSRYKYRILLLNLCFDVFSLSNKEQTNFTGYSNVMFNLRNPSEDGIVHYFNISKVHF